MGTSKIYYIGYYDLPNNPYPRYIYLPATNKMKYIASVLKEYNDNVNIVSPAFSLNKNVFCAGSKTSLDEGMLKLFPSYLNSFKPLQFALKKLILLHFMLYLIFNVKKDDQVFVYHALSYMWIMKLIKKLKRCKLIIEVEEIYGDVANNNRLSNKELGWFKHADGYIFPTEMLNEKINTSNKPYAIIYGTYHVGKQYDRDLFNDNRTHVVYAGTFDPRKGSLSVIKSAKYLDNNFHIHILGFGSEKDTNNIIDTIRDISAESQCVISYDGLLNGESYEKFIQNCDIGLSPQDTKSKFNGTSFPSKILSYLGHGLKVVSVNIPAIKKSTINSNLFFYDGDEHITIAEKIIEAAMDKSNADDQRNIVKYLDHEFRVELKKLI